MDEHLREPGRPNKKDRIFPSSYPPREPYTLVGGVTLSRGTHMVLELGSSKDYSDSIVFEG